MRRITVSVAFGWVIEYLFKRLKNFVLLCQPCVSRSVMYLLVHALRSSAVSLYYLFLKRLILDLSRAKARSAPHGSERALAPLRPFLVLLASHSFNHRPNRAEREDTPVCNGRAKARRHSRLQRASESEKTLPFATGNYTNKKEFL